MQVRGAPWVVSALLVATMIAALRFEGRRWYCACEGPQLWVSNVWSSHCSQHLLDPYSLTHVSHGFVFCGLFALLLPRARPAWRLAGAVAIAAGWEVLENSSLVIDRYRQATMSLDYLGDSVTNSLGDVLCCAVGFVLARRLGWKGTLLAFVVSELVLLALIRDNLTLNVVMLTWPIDAVREWQAAGK